MRILIVLLLALSYALPAMAAETSHSVSDQAQRYRMCLSLTRSDPDAAQNEAVKWRANGGGTPAIHCEALALVALGRYAEAARQLTAIANDQENSAMRPQLLDQAGNAWLLAGQPGFALPLFSDAIAASPANVDFLADRARARAMHADWHGAETDLDRALGLDPQRADLYVLRASARHAQGNLPGARSDIARALEIVPDYPEALVERGKMKMEFGDRAGAQADWHMVLRDAPGSDAAKAAEAGLDGLKAKAKK